MTQRYILATCYLWALFYLAFNTAHLLFALKYWSLSLKIEIILQKRQEDTKLGLKLNIIFLAIMSLIITGSVLIIVDQYQFWVFEDFR